MTELAGAEPRRRRLLILCTCSHIGGVERIVLGLSRQFSDRGWEVETVFPHPTDD